MEPRLLRRRKRLKALMQTVLERDPFSDRWERLADKFALAHGLPPKDAEFVKTCLMRDGARELARKVLEENWLLKGRITNA